MNLSTPVFLLHGLGARPITLYPLELYLNVVLGFQNTYRPGYPVNEMDLDQCVNYLDTEMRKHASIENEIILIGQSMGGVVANSLYKKGWKIRLAVYIGAPLHGASVLGQIEAVVPTVVWNWFYKKPYGFLKGKEREPTPEHPFHTISMAWPFTNFDGCVYRAEATLDTETHTHLPWSDHRLIIANPRLWYTVGELVIASGTSQREHEYSGVSEVAHPCLATL